MKYKKIFGLIKIKDGWKGLGKVNEISIDGGIQRYKHSFCKSSVYVGKEDNGRLFHYCKRCDIEVN